MDNKVETKICNKCKLDIPLSGYGKYKPDKLRGDCKECHKASCYVWNKKNDEWCKKRNKTYRNRKDVKERRAKITREWNRRNIDSTLLTHARKRAKCENVICTINKSDIIVPKKCPALGIDIFVNDRIMGDNSPTIDRIVPKLGYVPSNICVISQRANRIKNDATVEEIGMIYEWLKSIQSK